MSMVISILESFLGTPMSHYEHKSQIQFDCPMCSQDKGLRNGDGKGNLAINYKLGVYKCWSCWTRNDMHGPIPVLIKKFGSPQNYTDYLLVAPKNDYEYHDNTEQRLVLDLPESFLPFSEATPYNLGYNEAYAYLKGRGLDDEIIHRFNIGFTIDGNRKNRIIIPSYDINGELNYFIARAWSKWNKFKYLNPEADKELIIFNEHKINWNATVYLVEGAFDHIVTPNSIPLLGKFVSDKLFYDLQTKAKGDVIIVLDGGAEERADTLFLYKKLNVLKLYNRLKVVYLSDGLDLSLIYQNYGKRGILTSLRTASRIKESKL